MGLGSGGGGVGVEVVSVREVANLDIAVRWTEVGYKCIVGGNCEGVDWIGGDNR